MRSVNVSLSLSTRLVSSCVVVIQTLPTIANLTSTTGPVLAGDAGNVIRSGQAPAAVQWLLAAICAMTSTRPSVAAFQLNVLSQGMPIA